MTPLTVPKTISDSRVIAGFFREALFHSRILFFENERFSAEALLTDFQESSTRAKSDDRYLILTARASNAASVEHAGVLTFRCAFPNFVATWTGSLVLLSNSQYKTPLPNEITILNSRSASRISLTGLQAVRLQVSIQTGGLHTSGSLTIDNFSYAGIGGILTASSGMPITHETLIRGVFRSENGSLRVAGRVMQADLLVQSAEETGENTYRVGLRQSFEDSNSTAADAQKPLTDRRKFQRVPTALPLSLTSPLNPEHKIELQVKDASVSGFAAALANPLDSILLPLGCAARVAGTSLIAEVVAIDGPELRFQIIYGDSSDRLDWLKKLSRFLNGSVSRTSPTGEDIIELFCESGAAASGYLKAQAWLANDLKAGFASDTNDGTWIHKWIERTNSGEIRGHISAIRIADSSWFIGDIAGMMASDRRISKEFLPGFITSFRDHCLSAVPCPRVLVSWNNGHPYWADFEKHIGKQAPAFILGQARTIYRRLSRSSVFDSGKSTWSTRTVSADDYSEINRIQSQLSGTDAAAFLRLFDFSIESFASPSLQGATSKGGHQFRREYIIFGCDEGEYLLILQNYPLGASPLRTEDTPWLIPIRRLSDSRLDSGLHAEIQRIALSKGFSFPGVLEIVEGNIVSSGPATKVMVWTILHPKVLDFFEVPR